VDVDVDGPNPALMFSVLHEFVADHAGRRTCVPCAPGPWAVPPGLARRPGDRAPGWTAACGSPARRSPQRPPPGRFGAATRSAVAPRPASARCPHPRPVCRRRSSSFVHPCRAPIPHPVPL
jgi:hypothetical protein